MERRDLLKAATVAAAAPLLTATSARADDTGAFDADSPRFALAVLPDTQYLFDADSANPAPLAATFDYLLRQRADDNIAFLTHLGDVTEHGSEREIALAGDTFRMIDGRLPYSVLAGNHDVDAGTDDRRGDTAYLRAFGPSRFRGGPTFTGASDDGYNSAHVVTAAGRQWLILALDWRISDAGLAWAQQVLRDRPRLPAVITTHDLASAGGDGTATLSGNGRRLWDRLIRDHDQIFLAVGGHYWPPGRTVLTNAAGHDVHIHIANYQDRYYGGGAMIRLSSTWLAAGSTWRPSPPGSCRATRAGAPRSRRRRSS